MTALRSTLDVEGMQGRLAAAEKSDQIGETMFTITDTITGQTVTVEYGDEIAQAILSLNPGAEDDVRETAEALQTAVRRGEPLSGWEAACAVTVEETT